MDNNNKKKVFIIILILLGVFLFGAFSFISKPSKETDIKTIPGTLNQPIETLQHNGVNIDALLSQENYKKVGIDPNKYATFKDFLSELKTYSGVSFDPLKENFSIAQEISSGETLYTPFRFATNASNFDNKINKNLAILDIYTAYKKGTIFGGRNSSDGKKVIFDDEFQHTETSELSKIFSSQVNVFNYIKKLKETKDIGESKQELLAYLDDLVGDYSKAKVDRVKLCSEYKVCNKQITLIVSGKVTDESGKPVSGVKVENLNNTQFSTTSKSDGTYTLEFKVFPFSHVRFKSTILGYSDGFGTYSLNDYFSPNPSRSINLDFKIQKAGKIVGVDKTNVAQIKKGKYFVIEYQKSKYFVPIDGLYFKNGKKYDAFDFNVYLYFFTKDSNMDNLLENDTFEPVLGYVGNIMKTFGMPYIQFIDKKSGEEIFVRSSNPMILQNSIYHMKELYENHDKIYEPLTKDDMKLLVTESEKSDGYPIDFNFLTSHKMLRWPAWWALDRETGVWSNVPHRVVNEEGLVELPFYSIKDK